MLKRIFKAAFLAILLIWASCSGDESGLNSRPDNQINEGTAEVIQSADSGGIPSAPTALHATAVSDIQIDLDWTDNSAIEDGFSIERYNGSVYEEITTVGPDVTTFQDTPLGSSTTYYYRVRAYTISNGYSEYSNISAATTFNPDLPSPSNLSATPASSSQINLSWTDNSSDEDYFIIERHNGSGYVEIDTVGPDVTAYQDMGLAGATTYSYRVRAYSALFGYSSYSNTAATVTYNSSLAAPSGLTATSVSSSQIDLAWTDNSSGEDSFRIERYDGQSYVEVGSVGAGVTTYQDMGLSGSTLYYYRIRAYGAAYGYSSYSNISAATTFNDSLAAPSDFKARPLSSSQIRLTWTDNSSAEDSFRIERHNGSKYVEIDSVGSGITTYIDFGLSGSTIYSYRVRAYSAAYGYSTYSNTSATKTYNPTIDAPTGLNTTPAASDQIDLSWTDNSTGEDSFRIERYNGFSFVEVNAVGPDITNYSDIDLIPATTYLYRVRAYSAAYGYSGYSNTRAGTTLSPTIPEPTNLVANAASAYDIDLTWEDNSSSEDSFRIERLEGGTYVEIDSVGANVTTYRDSGLSGATIYTYRVRAHSGTYGYSGYSNTAATVTDNPEVAAPYRLRPRIVSTTQIDLRWVDMSNNEDNFRIEKYNGTKYVEVATVPANVTIYQDMGLTPATRYMYRIRAYNSTYGYSAYSNQIAAWTVLRWYVNDDAPPGGDGMSWPTAFNEIQDGVKNSTTGTEVWVAQGVYTNTSSYTTNEVILMKEGCAYYGGFMGYETDLSERQYATVESVLDGKELSYHIVTGATDAILDGFTLTGGKGGGIETGETSGGGMYNFDITGLLVQNCIFNNNSAMGNGGGAIYNENASATINNCLFTDNFSKIYGTAIANYYSAPGSVLIINCTFSGNTSEYGDGSTIYNYDSSPTIMNCIMWGNNYPMAPEIDDAGASTSDVSYSDIAGIIHAGYMNIDTDPMFIAPAAGNYRLGMYSPCRDSGNPDPMYNDPDGTQNDMGVYGGPGGESDMDRDGMPDKWENIYGLDMWIPEDADLDPDMDGWTNLEEFNYGTDPNYPDKKVWYVDADAVGYGDGTSWWDAFHTIQEAVDMASAGEMIWVAGGVYTNESPNPTDEVLLMKDCVKVYGGFMGYEIELWERRYSTEETVLDGKGTSYHVVVGASSARLDGFTVTGGNANGYSIPEDGLGGGMFNEGVDRLEVVDCVFRDNYAEGYDGGGAMFNTSSMEVPGTGSISVDITNCLFVNNSVSEYYGTAITNYYADYESIYITNCTFSGNHSAYSGASTIYNYGSVPIIMNCIFWANDYPAGMEIYDSGSSSDVTYSDVHGGFPGTGNIDMDPMFIAPAAGNFRLGMYSPCRDSGNPDPMYNDPDGTQNDMGVYGGPGGESDMDRDGMPDNWENIYGLDMWIPEDADQDPDMDGWTNLEEFNYGMDPNYPDRNIWYVNPDAFGYGDGTSWWDAFHTIQEAVDMASPGEMIWVAGGVYTNESPNPTDEVLLMKDCVKVYGGFMGYEIELWERRYSTQETVLDGKGSSYHVVIGASSARLDGFTVTGGNANGYSYPQDSLGGGMYNEGVDNLEVTNCVFRDNYAEGYQGGGAIFNTRGMYGIGSSSISITIRNCLFSNNKINEYSLYGSAISNYSDNPGYDSISIINCTFSGNVNNDGYGITIYNSNASPIIMNCIFWGNSEFDNEIYDDYNSYSEISYSDIHGGYSGPGYEYNNIDMDPMFIAPAAGNYRLGMYSPCRDAGNPDPMYNDPDGTQNDMGVYGGPGGESDMDRDGMPDNWENIYGLDMWIPEDADQDPDMDGWTNLEEFNYGMDPNYPDRKVWYVDADAVGYGDGTSWWDAFNYIQDAVDAASPGEMVWVAGGTYTHPLGPATNEAVLKMKDCVKIYGGFMGWEFELYEREYSTAESTLDGLDSSGHVVIGASSAKLDGFTVTGGNTTTASYPYYPAGGGMYNEGVDNLEVTNCVFRDNYADAYEGGGAIFNTRGLFGFGSSSISITIRNCLFSNNKINEYSLYGSAISNYSDNPGYDSISIINCTFSGNVNNDGYGITIYNSNASPIIMNCIFWGNSEFDNEIYDDYNSYSEISYSDIQGGYSGPGYEYNNIDTDPMFIATPEGNFHIGPSSPCRDAGNPDPMYNDPDGSRNDMGVYGGQGSIFDSDYDGMPDFWEQYYSLDPYDPSDAAGNPDGDGYLNLEEFNNGTDPWTFDQPLADAIGVDCPIDVNESDVISCPVILSSGTGLCSVGPGDTCGGSIDVDCVGPYTAPAQGEAAGSDCVAEVLKGSAFDSHTVNIIEENQNPTISLTCPSSVDETNGTSCSLSVSDSDLPPQTLSCSVNAASTCTGVTLTDCVTANIPAQGEAVGPGTCSVVVDVQDDFLPPGAGSDSADITINEVNLPPTNGAPGTLAGDELTVLTFTATPGDPDLPAQTLTCSLVSATGYCSSGSFNTSTCEWTWTPAEAEGPTTCSVTTRISDGLLNTDVTTTVTVNEVNQNPSITVDCPESVDESTATSCALSVADTDIPAQNLTCSFNAIPPQVVNIGNGTTTRVYPFGTIYHDERTQVIYTASEIGAAGKIESLELNVITVPGQTMENFTIRMKHTDLSNYNLPYAWEGPSSGWTTVYQDNLTISSTGWHIFTLTTPFQYNGTQNLMIDFSFNNSSSSTDGTVYSYFTGTTRTLFFRTNSGYQDPLQWSGTSSPVPSGNTYNPNIRFTLVTTPTCSGMILNGCTSVDIPAQGESSPASCSLSISISDDFTPPGTGVGGDTINIVKSNLNPTITVDCPSNVGENTDTTCALTASDDDLPHQTLSCSLDAATTCTGVTLTDCTQADVPAQGEGANPRTCDVVVNVQDDYSPVGAGQGTDTITLDDDNADPTVTVDCPASVDEFTATSCALSVADPDTPVGNLTCSFATAQTEVDIGSGSSALIYPFGTYQHDERAQIIYLASEIGMAGPITSLALNVSTVPGQTMEYFTIRMKHTDLSSYSSYLWEGPTSGWTTVFQGNVTISATGWYSISFTTPFEYNGVQNLMVDFSFNNSSSSTDGRVYGFNSGAYRALYLQTNSVYGDPLLWSGSNPPRSISYSIPNLRLDIGYPACTGMILNGCASVDIPAQGENNPAGCGVEVSVSDGFTPPGTGEGGDAITIVEINQNPAITVDCPANVGENTATTCALLVSDVDLPPQMLFCSVDASTTCTGVTLTGCSQVNVPAQGEGSNPRTCDVVINVEDNFAPPGVNQGSDTITLDDDNANPTVTVDCPANVMENSATTCALTVSDGDLPPQTLSCSVDASTTCTGVTLTDCTSADVPAQGEGPNPRTCDVVINVEDDYTPPGVGQGSDTITLDDNPWLEVGAGSASGGGISNNSGWSDNPSIAVDSSGYPVVAWEDGSDGADEIYIKRWNGSAWVDIGTNSSSGGGISNNSGMSSYPSLALDSSGYPVVAWHDFSSGNWEIYIKRWDGGSWVDVGTGSSSGGGISNNSGISYNPSLALDSNGYPVVAWQDTSSGNYEIYIKRWDGGAWVDIGTGSSSGGGISNNSGSSYNPSLALDSFDYPVVAWQDYSSGYSQIYIKRWDGFAWVEVGAGSSSGGGISNSIGNAWYESVSLDSFDYPVVVWEDYSLGKNEIYIKRWDGGSWVDIGTGSSSGGGISNNGEAFEPSFALDSYDYPLVTWTNGTASNPEIYIKRWDGGAWVDIGPDSSSGGGISMNDGASDYPSIALDSSDHPFVAWQDDTPSPFNTEIYIKYWIP